MLQVSGMLIMSTLGYFINSKRWHIFKKRTFIKITLADHFDQRITLPAIIFKLLNCEEIDKKVFFPPPYTWLEILFFLKFICTFWHARNGKVMYGHYSGE